MEDLSQTSKSTVTTITGVGLTSILLVPANAKRVKFFIWNNSANSIYITLGPVSSSSTPAIILASYNSYESREVCWTGPISGIKNTGVGTVTVYELER